MHSAYSPVSTLDLGFIVDSLQMTVEVDPVKYSKMCAEIRVFLEGWNVDANGVPRAYDGKLLERLRGKIVANLIVVPHLCTYTSEMDKAITWLYSKDTHTLPKSQFNLFNVKRELERWLELDGVQLTRKLYNEKHTILRDGAIDERRKTTVAWTDASGFLGGSHHIVVHDDGTQDTHESCYTWTPEEELEAINYKELSCVRRIIMRYGRHFQNQRLILMCDNRAAVSMWENLKSKVLKYNRLIVALIDLLGEYNIHLTLLWCNTKAQRADAPSRTLTHTESRLRRGFVAGIRQSGITVDCFATPDNKITRRYMSRYFYDTDPDHVHHDSLSYVPQDDDVLFLHPPSSVLMPALNVRHRQARCSVILLHEFIGANIPIGLATELSDFRVLIGTRATPACITPCRGNNIHRMGSSYYRLYTEPHKTYLFLRGYSENAARRFYQDFRNFKGTRHVLRRCKRTWRYKLLMKYEFHNCKTGETLYNCQHKFSL